VDLRYVSNCGVSNRSNDYIYVCGVGVFFYDLGQLRELVEGPYIKRKPNQTSPNEVRAYEGEHSLLAASPRIQRELTRLIKGPPARHGASRAPPARRVEPLTKRRAVASPRAAQRRAPRGSKRPRGLRARGHCHLWR